MEEGLQGLLVVIFYAALGLAGAGWLFGPHSWINAIWYAVEYNVGPNQVHTSDKPSDCDWSRAPLGNKGCRYNSTVGAYNTAGVLVGETTRLDTVKIPRLAGRSSRMTTGRLGHGPTPFLI
jgi:hypothetical protein